MFSIIRKFFDLLLPKEKYQLYFLVIALVIKAFIEMAGIASIMPFMAVVSNSSVVNTNKYLNYAYTHYEFTSLNEFLIFLGFLVLILIVISNSFKALTTWMTLKYDNRLNYKLAHRLLAKYMARPYSFFLNRNTADMGKNVLSEVGNVIRGVLSTSTQVCANIFVSLFIFVLLLIVDPLIAVTIAAFLGSAYAIIFIFVRRVLTRISKEQVIANSMKFKTASEALSGIKDLKILGRESFFLDKFAAHARLHARNNVTVGVIAQLPRFALEVMAFGGILLIILYFLGTSHDSRAMVPLLALYAYSGYRLLPALQQIFAGISTIRTSLAALDILHRDFMDQTVSATSAFNKTKPENLYSLSFSRALELRNVTFSYRGFEVPVLKGLNLTITPNTTVGIVGTTGSGKTTMVDLILGLLPPTSGKLLVDGLEISGDSIPRWQLNLGYVPQMIFLSDDTITSNIAFGVPENEIDMEAVTRAAKIANLHQFIENDLPMGFNTVIGERGVRLSGGQRQRIGIARALYRNPSVLIMDEATSALDGITEEAIMEALLNLSGQKTVILIAHRLTTVKQCDVIYIVEHGQIANHGTYDELMVSSPWFQKAARHVA